MLGPMHYVDGWRWLLVFVTAFVCASGQAREPAYPGSGQAPTGQAVRSAGWNSVIVRNAASKPIAPAIYRETKKLNRPHNSVRAAEANDVWLARLAQEVSHSPSMQMLMSGGALPQHIYLAMVAAASLDKEANDHDRLPSQPLAVVKAGATSGARPLADAR